MQETISKQTTFQLHPSQDQLNQFSQQIDAIARQLINPRAVVLLAERPQTLTRIRANAKSRQLLTAQQKLNEALAILQKL